MRISKIEIQKKNKKRYNLYSDDIFLFGVSEDTLIHFQINKGSEYSETTLFEIQAYEEQVQCLFQAYRYLSRRPHLTAEIIRKLRLKGYENSLIQLVIQTLQEKKYLNDPDFIQLFVSDQIRLKHSGPLLIKKKLLEKGAKSEAVDTVLSEDYPDHKQFNNAQKLLNKKLQNNPKIEKEKLVRFLQQKGFPWDIIRLIDWPDVEE